MHKNGKNVKKISVFEVGLKMKYLFCKQRDSLLEKRFWKYTICLLLGFNYNIMQVFLRLQNYKQKTAKMSQQIQEYEVGLKKE